MITKNIAEMTARIDAHRAADLLAQGTYYEASTGKGCFIGCLAHGNQPEALAESYGIPVMLTRVLERIFESLPKNEAADFFTAIPRAIGADGKDLSRVVWAFLGETLRSLPPQKPEIQAVIDPVIAEIDRLAAGKQQQDESAAWAAPERVAARAAVGAVSAGTAWAAAGTAWAAARAAAEAEAAAWAAAWAAAAEAEAWAAAWAAAAEAEAAKAAVWAAAWAAPEAALGAENGRQRDSILRLMAEAPMQKQST